MSEETGSSEPPIEPNPSSLSSSESTNPLYNDFNRLKTFPLIWTAKFNKLELVLAGFSYAGSDHNCICVFCNINLDASQYSANSNLEKNHKNISPNCDFANGRSNNVECAIDFNKEQHRLISFLKVNWTAPVDPYDLAKWGFYYLGPNDASKCQFCRLEVRGWQRGDRGETEHERWNSACPLLRGRWVENVPFGQEQPRNVHSDSTNVAIDAALINCLGEGPHAPASHLGVVALRDAKHPQFTSTSARLGTYKLWPMSKSQRPEELVEAGFYYTCCGDKVICFYCGGGLKDWGAGDRAWVEHAVWFQNCQYLQLIKGPAFVEQVRALRVAQSASELQQFYQSTLNAVTPSSKEPSREIFNKKKKNESTGQKLQEKAKTARRSTEASEMSDAGIRVCKVCYEKELNIVFLPCGHMVTCLECAKQLNNCPLCRAVVNTYIRAFLS